MYMLLYTVFLVSLTTLCNPDFSSFKKISKSTLVEYLMNTSKYDLSFNNSPHNSFSKDYGSLNVTNIYNTYITRWLYNVA